MTATLTNNTNEALQTLLALLPTLKVVKVEELRAGTWHYGTQYTFADGSMIITNPRSK